MIWEISYKSYFSWITITTIWFCCYISYNNKTKLQPPPQRNLGVQAKRLNSIINQGKPRSLRSLERYFSANPPHFQTGKTKFSFYVLLKPASRRKMNQQPLTSSINGLHPSDRVQTCLLTRSPHTSYTQLLCPCPSLTDDTLLCGLSSVACFCLTNSNSSDLIQNQESLYQWASPPQSLWGWLKLRNLGISANFITPLLWTGGNP